MHATIPGCKHVVGALQAVSLDLLPVAVIMFLLNLNLESLELRRADTSEKHWNGDWQMVRPEV